MPKLLIVGFLLLCLTGCQSLTGDQKLQETCPLTRLDTRAQEEQCRHFAGEEPYDKARAVFLKKKMEELNCGLFF